MAASVTWATLRELAGFRTEKGCAISLYLNLDPSEVPTPGDAQSRMNALLTAAEKIDRSDLTHDARAGLKADFERIADQFEEQHGRHDQGGWSQARYQRHIEKLVQEHLKGVAEELDRNRKRLHSPKIVLVCSEETRSEFAEELSKEARDAIVGWANAEAHASPAELLAAVAPILTQSQAKDEADTIERWR